MMNLQCLDEAVNALQTCEHRRNGHHGAAFRGDAGGIIKAGKQAGLEQEHTEPVHQRHGQLAGAEEENHGEENKLPSLHFEHPRLPPKPEPGK